MSQEEKLKQLMDELTPERSALYQALAVMLVKAVIEEKIAVHFYRETATGRLCAVIGREERRERPDIRATEVDFIPLATLFDHDPTREMQPLHAGENHRVQEQVLQTELDEHGQLVDVKELGSFVAAKPGDTSKLN